MQTLNTRTWRVWLKAAEGYFGGQFTVATMERAYVAYRHGIAPLDYVVSVCR